MALNVVQVRGVQGLGVVDDISLGFLSNVGPGNTIVVLGAVDATNTGSHAVTDSLGNTYTKVEDHDALGAHPSIHVAKNIIGGACTVTLGYTGSDFSGIGIIEISSADVSITSIADQDSGTGFSSTPSTPDLVTAGNAIILGIVHNVYAGGINTIFNGAGYTTIFNANDDSAAPSFNCQYKIVGAGTHPVNWTLGVAEGWAAAAIAIKEAVLTTGNYYEKVFDYGAVISNVIAHVDYAFQILVGTVAVTIELSSSTDGVSYSTPTIGSTGFFPSLRYLKVKLIFSPATDKSLIEVCTLRVFLDVKIENDGGEVTANAADVGGTQVNFNKSFKDIRSVTATAKDISDIAVVVDFVDVPNPTGFKVYAFDSTGHRITKLVEWKARGVV